MDTRADIRTVTVSLTLVCR